MNKRKKHQEGLFPEQTIRRRITADEPDSYQQLIRLINMARVSDWIDTAVSRQAWREPSSFINEITVCYLHALCMNILIPNAGDYKTRQVWVGNHTPPEADQIPRFMKEFVEELNEKWRSYDNNDGYFQIAAFALWRLNWIHPFPNGNGRTARSFSYFLMSMKAGINFPVKGGYSIRDLLQNKYRYEYVQALKEADNGNIIPLEQLLEKLLKEQVSYALARK